MTVLDGLKATRKALEDRGRTSWVLVDDDGCLCLLGALGVGVIGDEYAIPSQVDYSPFGRKGEASAHVRELLRDLPDEWLATLTDEDFGPYSVEELREDMLSDHDYDQLCEFNDAHDDEYVFGLLDRTIARLEAGAA